MKKLLLKSDWSKDELESMDSYYSDDNISELMEVDNNTIIKFINACENLLGYCISKINLNFYLLEESFDATWMFDINNLDYYDKLIELTNYFSFNDSSLAYFIGDYFKNNNDNFNALKYYNLVFKKGFNLCNDNYYDSLVNYLDLLNTNPCEILKELISSSPIDNEYSVDFINTYLLLIINLEKYSDEYLNYINDAIKIAIPVVRKHQEFTKDSSSISDTDEERDLCELLSLKLEYYVEKRNYTKAFNIYNQLTEEIGKSDCMRYYHARNKYYQQMLEYMSYDYPELKFFEDIGYYKFKVICNASLNLNDYITLEKNDGMTFKFKIIYIYEDEYTIVPILPLLGEGGRMTLRLLMEDNNIYLKNILSH